MTGKHVTCLAILLALAGSLHAATIYVDGDPNHTGVAGSQSSSFSDIQQAIDAAMNGDTIIVMPGRYLSADPWKYAELKFNNKNIRLQSSAPTDFEVVAKTILCGVVIFGGLETTNCQLQGFRIQNHDSGGILGNGTRATISHCMITGNGPCGATVLKDCHGLVQNCLIADNTTFHACLYYFVVSGCTSMVNCTVTNNIAGIDASGGMSLHNCIAYNNSGADLYAEPPQKPTMDYSLIANRFMAENPALKQTGTLVEGDPCFVRVGVWTGEVAYEIQWGFDDQSGTTRIYKPGATLTEGDYHLMSEGWRWNGADANGSHWCSDSVTSVAIDAGDPLDSLGEEPNRVPQDPNGLRGVNHAINLGVYGGTSQASLAPTPGRPWDANAVNLQDYWPLAKKNEWHTSLYHGSIVVADDVNVSGITARRLDVRWDGSAYALGGVYLDYALRMTKEPLIYHGSYPQGTSGEFVARYPQYLGIGSTINAPDNPVAKTPRVCSAVLVQGTLEEVIAGTGLNPKDFIKGPWNDVIALKEKKADGTLTAPFTIFARGFGPLMLGGTTVNLAIIDGTERW